VFVDTKYRRRSWPKTSWLAATATPEWLPRQPVDLVDDDDIDPAGPDVGEQALQRRPLQSAARPTIVIVGSGQYPALVALKASQASRCAAARVQCNRLLCRSDP